MIAIEKAANQAGIAYETMMENAGKGLADWVYKHLDCKRGVVGLVGSGNNGGDTLIALTQLATRGIRTVAGLVRPREEDHLIARYQARGGALIDLTSAQNISYLEAALSPGAILLDGMLGTGFRLPLHGDLLEVMERVQQAVQRCDGIRVIAVDCPSGVDCDTGEASEVSLGASHTLTMAAVKQGLLKPPAHQLAGDIQGVDIGIGDLDRYLDDPVPAMIGVDLAREQLPERPATGHKGTFGTALVIAGSRPFTGAAYLAGKAAYRAGCGLVNMAVLPPVQQSLAGRLIEAVWTPLLELGGGYDPKGAAVLAEPLSKADALAIGPGWGLQASNRDFLSALLTQVNETHPDLPVVVDADGLKLLAEIPDWWLKLPPGTILTPHPGEMAILTGRTIADIQADRWAVACHYAKAWGATLVLKGALTVIGFPNGKLFVNPISDSALGTAGSGDVLTGVLCGLMAQDVSAPNAAVLGVWLHGRAGQLAHEKLGVPESVTALDILKALPQALGETKKAGH
jgi:NAD(P)H-hydrate epimerase